MIVADLVGPDGAHLQYDEDEVMGLALFLRDTLPAGMTHPAVPAAPAVLALPA